MRAPPWVWMLMGMLGAMAIALLRHGTGLPPAEDKAAAPTPRIWIGDAR